MYFKRILSILMTLPLISDLHAGQSATEFTEDLGYKAKNLVLQPQENDKRTGKFLSFFSPSSNQGVILAQNPISSPSSGSKNGSQKPADSQSQLAKAIVEFGTVYLRPYQGGTDFAQTVSASALSSNSNAATTVPSGTNKPMDFDFDWGARASLGYQGENSNLRLLASYLYFSSTTHKSVDYTPAPGGIPTNVIFADMFLAIDIAKQTVNFFTKATSKWQINFNMLDLTFGKKYQAFSCMNFEPFIGLKGVYLWEKQTSNYTQAKLSSKFPGGTGKIKQKTDLKGAGPIAGLNLDWRIIKWLSLTGTFDAAILASKVETQRFNDNVFPTFLWVGNSSDLKGTLVLDGSLALRGVYCWPSDRYIDFKIGYEQHYIFETMKHAVLENDTSTDLSLMGWFATIGFGF